MKHLFFLLTVLLVPLVCLCSCLGTEEPPVGPPGEEIKTLPTLNGITFSIGEADATLLWNEDHAVLIDAGEEEDAAEILRFMQRKGIKKLDALIVTHFDKDHVGGADGILNGIAVDAVYETFAIAEKESTDDVISYRATLAQKGMQATVVREKTSLTFGDAKYVIYPPHKDSYNKKESNNSSLAVHLSYGETAFLFAADAMEDRISELVTEENIACDLLKVPYHGDVLNNLSLLLTHTTPKYGIITCSDKNPETPSKLSALQNADVTVFLTRMGDVEFSSNGKKVTM